MANPIDKRMTVGTIGELLVQLRLLQYGIQAAPPIKDSGNDLIALKGRTIKLIQVKTTAEGVFPKKPGKKRIYDLLAIVDLAGYDTHLNLDKSSIYLVPKGDLVGLPLSLTLLGKYKLEDIVGEIFKKGHLKAKKRA